MKKLFTLLAIAITLISTAQESTLLRLNYEVGDQFLVSMDMEQAGMMSMNIEMGMDVKEVTDTIYNIDMTIKSIKMNVSQGGQTMSYDSKTAEEELDDMGKMMASQFAPMLSATILTKTTNRAEVIETTVEPPVNGMDQFTNSSGTVVYPKEAVKVGDSWTINKLEKGMDMTMIYTVKAIGEEIVEVEISGTIELLAEGTISGNMEIDKATGNVNYSTMDMNMVASGQEMTMKINMTSKKL
ncbi:MAG: DUF6263 family protein [Urechidicola sp.]|nr:DUF6263 family protein [Urechidicola sp.]